GQVVLQDWPGDRARVARLRMTGREEPGEPGERQCPGIDGRERASGRQPEPGPALDRIAEPGLADPAEARRAASAPGGDAQPPGIPVVRRPLAIQDGRLAADYLEPRPVLPSRHGAGHRSSSSRQTPARRSASRMSARSRWT